LCLCVWWDGTGNPFKVSKWNSLITIWISIVLFKMFSETHKQNEKKIQGCLDFTYLLLLLHLKCEMNWSVIKRFIWRKRYSDWLHLFKVMLWKLFKSQLFQQARPKMLKHFKIEESLLCFGALIHLIIGVHFCTFHKQW